jgi:NADH-quinone oxidoreductase subunit A
VLLGGIFIFFLIQNIVLFSLIFWVLTVVGEKFFKSKNHKTKKNYYECGFKSTVDINVQFNFNFIIICIFLILYDVEFMYLMPFFLNMSNISIFQFIIFMFFMLLIVVSLIYDWQNNTLNWQI